jgi:hypothetical protein
LSRRDRCGRVDCDGTRAIPDRFLAICPGKIANEYFNPAVPVLITFRAKNVAWMIASRSLLGFYNEECMPVLFLFVTAGCPVASLLSADLGTRDSYGA